MAARLAATLAAVASVLLEVYVTPMLLLPEGGAQAFRIGCNSGSSCCSNSSSSSSSRLRRVSVHLHAKKPSWHTTIAERRSKQQQRHEDEDDYQQQQQQQQQMVLRLSMDEPSAPDAAAALGIQKQQQKSLHAELQRHGPDAVGGSLWISDADRRSFQQQQKKLFPKQEQEQQQQDDDDDERGPYFTPSNVKDYHRYNPFWSPARESYGRASHAPHQASRAPFGDSPKRPPRESDLALPSVPFGWRVFAALSLLKLPFLWRQQHQHQDDAAGEKDDVLASSSSSSSMLYLWESLAHRRFHLAHITWARASTRLPDVGGRALSLYQLRSIRSQLERGPQNAKQRGPLPLDVSGGPFLHEQTMKETAGAERGGAGEEEIKLLSPYVGDYLVFASPSLHHAQQFVQSNPKAKAGLYHQQHLYECIDVTGEHLLLGKQERRSGGRDRLFCLFGFFREPPKHPNQMLSPATHDAGDAGDARIATAASAIGAARAAGGCHSRGVGFSAAASASAAPSSPLTPEEEAAASAAREHDRRSVISLLSERHLRFLCRSNCVHRRCFLLTPRKDSAADLLLPPELLLPITQQQRLRTLRRYKQRRQQATNAAAAATRVLLQFAAAAAGIPSTEAAVEGPPQASSDKTPLLAVASKLEEQQQQEVHDPKGRPSSSPTDAASAAAAAAAIRSAAAAAAAEAAAITAAGGDVSLAASAVSLMQKLLTGSPASAAAAAAGTSVAAATSLADPKSEWEEPPQHKQEQQEQQQHQPIQIDQRKCQQQEEQPRQTDNRHPPQEQQEQQQQHQHQHQQHQRQQDTQSEVPLASLSEAETLLFLGESAEEAKEFLLRLPFLSVFCACLLTEAVPLDFYGKCGVLTVPSLSADATALAVADADEMGEEEETETEGEDMVEWLLQHKEKLSPREDASVILDRPFYGELMNDWVYLQLPQGQFAAGGALPASAEEEAGGPPDPAVSVLNRDKNNPRVYVPGMWLYKPESQVLYRDKETGGILLGSGLDRRYSWEGQVTKAEQTAALLRMELALEELRKGGFCTDETDDTPPFIKKDGRLKILLNPQEKSQQKWTLRPLQEQMGQLGGGDDVPTGLELHDSSRLAGRPPAYRRLVGQPSISHAINAEFLRKVEAGEATPEEDPLRLTPEELELHETYGTPTADTPEDIPITTAWRETR